MHIDLFAQGQRVGKVSDAILSEISGIIPYTFDQGYFWVHNDSGDKAQMYLINSQAKLKTTVQLEGVNLIDCEDIARVECDGIPYLLLADIGNNSRNREVLSLYLFPEPKVDTNRLNVRIAKEQIKKIDVRYSDKRRDAEALFIDPVDQEVYIVSKRDFRSTLFSFSLNKIASLKQPIQLFPKLLLPFTFATGADISPNGNFVIIKNLTNIFIWERQANESVLDMLTRSYDKVPYLAEPQGEAVCFDLNYRHFYTISESPLGLKSYLVKYNY